MSNAAEAWAWKQDLPPREKFVLICLCDFYNDDQKLAWMKQQSIAERTGYSRQTVNAALQALEYKHGLIQSESRKYADGRRASNLYRVNFSARVKDVDTEASHVKPVDTVHVNAVDTVHVKDVDNKNLQHRTTNIERKGTTPAAESPGAESPASPSLGSQVDAALADPESPEARAFLEANGISTDQRPLWNLKKFLRQTLGDQADHPQVVGNLTAWAAAGHTLQEIRAAWLQAVARWKREPKGGKLRPVHFFVDLLNGSYKPDSHDLREQAEAAAAVQEQAQLSAPQPGDRVRLPDGTLDTVHDFDAWSNLVELVNTTSAFRPEDLQVIQ